MKKKAFTLAESLLVMMIVGVIMSSCLLLMKPNNYYKDACKKGGLNTLLKIDFASKQILAKYSVNYQNTKLLTTSGTQFSINDSGADANLALLYKKMLRTSKKTVNSTYTNSVLVDEAGNKINSDMKVSGFTQGFVSRNGNYIAFKLNSNCTTSETYIYNPSLPSKRSIANSCGLLFFDINANENPNILGVDQYIISIGKFGIQ